MFIYGCSSVNRGANEDPIWFELNAENQSFTTLRSSIMISLFTKTRPAGGGPAA